MRSQVSLPVFFALTHQQYLGNQQQKPISSILSCKTGIKFIFPFPHDFPLNEEVVRMK